MQHICISFGPGPFWKATAVFLERSVVAPEFIHDVIHSLEALSVFPTEWTDVLSACQCFSEFMRSRAMTTSHGRMLFKKEASVRDGFRLD